MTHTEEIFNAALAQPEAERGSYLDAACGGNSAIRTEVVSLLNS
ncbi:MAG: hypothetical protein ACI915_003860 [Gammaproteobacteria bacterium]|jgi:hypothetical protein